MTPASSTALRPARLLQIWRTKGPAQQLSIVLCLTLYAVLLAFLIPRHEPWADEAQSWQLARSLSLHELFGHYIHYEISPGLWHAFLWLLIRLHVSYAGMHWIVALVALITAAMLTIAAPFPLPLRLALPFSFFFAFQYAIVARNYVLFPAILLLLACVWHRRHHSPWIVAILLGLLANVALHGLAVAFGLAIVLAIELRRTPCEERPPWLAPAIFILILCGFATWCIVPPRDADLYSNINIGAHPEAFALLVHSLSRDYAWLRRLPLGVELAIRLVFHCCYVLGYGMSDPKEIGLAAWALLFWNWHREQLLRYSIPVLLLGALCAVTKFAFYHAGLIWILFLFLWWITWQQNTIGWIAIRQKLIIALITICTVIQIVWSIRAIRYDIAMPYSPNRDGARILQSYLDHGATVDIAVPPRRIFPEHGEFFVTGLEPYFVHEPFHNMRARFWIWTQDSGMRNTYLRDTANRSVIVLVEEIPEDPRFIPEAARLRSLGYTRAQTVCGQMYYPDSMSPLLCHAFYKPPPH